MKCCPVHSIRYPAYMKRLNGLPICTRTASARFAFLEVRDYESVNRFRLDLRHIDSRGSKSLRQEYPCYTRAQCSRRRGPARKSSQVVRQIP
jgi:hypothetical protein